MQGFSPLLKGYGLSATANGICCYRRYFSPEKGDYLKPRKSDKRKMPENNRDKFSKKSAKNLKVKINALLYSVDKKILLTGDNRHKVVFVTLTLPAKQRHSDVEIKSKCLNQLLTELRDKYGVTLYVWKAERQKNGNLHFHLLVNRYIPAMELRDSWNRILSKLGYIDDFEVKHGHRSPNSTDVHSLYKDKRTGKRIGSVVAYMAKYMSKKDEVIEGRYWYASASLSKLGKLCLIEPQLGGVHPYFSEFDRLVAWVESRNDKKVIRYDYFTFVCVSLSELQGFPLLFNRYNQVFDELCKGLNM